MPRPRTEIVLLPSRHGSGCSRTISGFGGCHAPDSWMGENTGLHGIAVEPDGDTLWDHTWLHTAVHRLREKGVLLLTPTEAEAYLASDEAAYWCQSAFKIDPQSASKIDPL